MCAQWVMLGHLRSTYRISLFAVDNSSNLWNVLLCSPYLVAGGQASDKVVVSATKFGSRARLLNKRARALEAEFRIKKARNVFIEVMVDYSHA